MLLSDGTNISCFTTENTRKYKQMQVNKNVALSINNLQIEGTVTLKGHPLDEENAGFIRMFKEKRPEVYKFWGPIFENRDNSAGVRVLEITPKKLTAYKRVPDMHLAILNVVTEKATKISMEEIVTIDYSPF
jgi:uncharacterized pyridoxamine 5'-phosphate oxidase family protein